MAARRANSMSEEHVMTPSLVARLAAVAAFAFAAIAQAAYPDKPVQYIIPFAPGGESDVAARLQQQVFKVKFNQDLIVVNKAGAGGALAWSQLNSMPGDGYTIMGVNLPHIVLQPLEPGTQFKTEDITPVYFFHYTPDAIVVPVDSPFRTFADLVKAAREKPESVSLAGSGTNSANHLASERLNRELGIKILYVPFKGTGDLVSAVLGNHVSGAAQSGVMNNIPDGETWLWTPAQPDRQAKRQMIALQQLPELIRRVKQLEKRLALKAEPAALPTAAPSQ
jgi:tripartite-type tricarboxylate transporter receptor subunit TctC